MELKPFELERYFGLYEFSVRHQLSCSDCQTLTVQELLALAAKQQSGWSGSVEPWPAEDTLIGALGAVELGYTESSGDPRLREQIARRYSGFTSDMILTAAPAEAIFLLFVSVLAPGDRVVVIDPCYQSLASLPEGLGCQVTPWKVRLGDGRWFVDLDELKGELAKTPKPKMVIVNFPHNPTGFVPEASQFRQILGLCETAGVLLFCDEMYRELSLFGDTPLPAGCTLSDHAVSLGGLSKSFGLPGLRLGWLASRSKELLSKAAQAKDYTTICTAGVVEFLGRAALTAEDALVHRARALVEQNIQFSESFFAAHPLLEWLPPKGGSVAFPRYLGPEGASALSQRAIKETDTLLLPAKLFGFPDNHFRVGLGRKEYPEALRAVFKNPCDLAFVTLRL